MSDMDAPNIVDDRKQKYRDKYAEHSLLELIGCMSERREEKERIEDVLTEINADFDVLRLELIPAAMEAQGIEGMKVEGVGRVTLTGDMYVRVTDQKALYEWLQEENLQDLIKETIAPSTLKAFAKNRIKSGKSIPDGLLKITPFTRAAITKA